MDLEIWRSWTRLVFLEPGGWEYALLALELLLSLAILVVWRRDFINLDRRRFLLLVGCVAAPFLSERVLVVVFPGRNLLSPPDVPFTPSQPFAPVVGMLPVVIAAAWLGPGPALLVGLAKGIARAGILTGGIAAPCHLGLLGFLVGFLLRQDYRGRLPRLARQPVVAVPLMTPFAALLLLTSALAHVFDSGLTGLDYAVSLTSSYFPPLLLESLVAALAVQAVYLSRPERRPIPAARRPAPYSRTLTRRLLCLFVPVIGLITVLLVYAVTAQALRLATDEAVDEMARDAISAAEGIPDFVQTGQGLLVEFAKDERLWEADRDALETRLRRDMRMVVFFDQLLLLGSDGQFLAAYPPQPATTPELAAEEQRLLERGVESGAPQIGPVHRSKQGGVILSFLAPMSDPSQEEQNGSASRVLLGRTRLDLNLVISRILEGLQWTNARGAGFIVDSRRRILAHPNPDVLLTTWEIEEGRSPNDSDLRGWAYESRDPEDNTRQLGYYLPVEGYPWGVVVHVPYDTILDQARQIAAPLLGLQILLGGGLVLIISLVTNWVTQPLQKLAAAADRIAAGDLSHPLEVGGKADPGGQDEVARLGIAFEDMRLRLRDRMEDLSLLLDVSQAVSATLELSQGVPCILEGALRATEAQVARLVVLSADGDPQAVMSRGHSRDADELRSLDHALARTAESLKRPLVIDDLRRIKMLLEFGVAGTAVRAVVALPIRARERVAAVMWVGYSGARRFSDTDIDLLSTLASQTSVLVENARLFHTAERERKRLAAILASTTDAVVVTDREDRISLVNPAAERVFGVRGENLFGHGIHGPPLPQALVDLYSAPLDRDEGLNKELALADGRTLYANVSAILSAEGQRLGHVSVMRDITHLKELDELKSDFVATVSHDLRGPLMFMRGYTAMLTTVGELNQSQQEYVERVLHGVNQMSNLVDDLLDLGRIEANVGLERQPCHLGAILVETVDSKQALADAKDVTLRMTPPTDREAEGAVGSEQRSAVIVSGDAALLRQAITNLVDNAIKYTPGGGEVVVELSKTDGGGTALEGEDRRAVVRVKDTGVGIAPEDQVRLFEKFYRIRPYDFPDVPGTGLGLSIVKSIVERHGGRVWVDSELNEGSTFTISLPLIERSAAEGAGD